MINPIELTTLLLLCVFFSIYSSIFFFYRWKIIKMINDIEKPIKVDPFTPIQTPVPILNPIDEQTIQDNNINT